jgi:hypothetical protein
VNTKITENKLKNKRFRTTEEAIIMAFFLLKDKICLKRLVKTAGISRATLYRHHDNLYRIVPDYEEYMVRKYKRVATRSLRFKRISLRALYEQMLKFMSNNARIMSFLFELDSHDFIEKMILILKPKIVSVSKVSNSEMLKIYIKEIVGVVEEWGMAGFESSKIDVTAEKMMFLTNTAYFRLSPIAGLA